MGLLLNTWKCLQGFCFLSSIHACRITWICQLQFLEAEPGGLGPPGAPARGRILAVALSRDQRGCCLLAGEGCRLAGPGQLGVPQASGQKLELSPPLLFHSVPSCLSPEEKLNGDLLYPGRTPGVLRSGWRWKEESRWRRLGG